MNLELLKKSLEEAPIVKRGKYPYFVHPITDGVPEIKSELLIEIKDELKHRIEKLGRIDKIVTIEAMGIPLATALSIDMGIPFVIVRKRSYGLPGEKCVYQKTGYSESKLYINDLKEGDKIVIVDDVLSTGGTLKTILSALKEKKVEVKGVFIVVNKGKCAEEIEKEFSILIDFLVEIEVKSGKVLVI